MSILRLHHVAVWVGDLERMRDFYVSQLGGRSGSRYENERTGFRSYFISFGGGGAQIELMAQGSRREPQPGPPALGYSHVALCVGSRAGVDAAVERLRSAGVRVVGEPRTTGDGYYEAVVEDPEGNKIELVE